MKSDAADDICDVCGRGDFEDGNLIVFCELCGLGVHQVCYGVEDLPEQAWYCHPCQLLVADALHGSASAGARAAGVGRGCGRLRKVATCMLCQPAASGAVDLDAITVSAAQHPNHGDRPQALPSVSYDSEPSVLPSSRLAELAPPAWLYADEKSAAAASAAATSPSTGKFTLASAGWGRSVGALKPVDAATAPAQTPGSTHDVQAALTAQSSRGQEDSWAAAVWGGLQWCHVSCALFLDEVRFGDADTLSPVLNVRDIDPARRSLRCVVCRQKGGCIQCGNGRCMTAYHPACAKHGGLQLEHLDVCLRLVSASVSAFDLRPRRESLRVFSLKLYPYPLSPSGGRF